MNEIMSSIITWTIVVILLGITIEWIVKIVKKANKMAK